jgi:glycosyltransferase involved in cell wall biosynthesis
LRVGFDASVIFSSVGGTRTYATQLLTALLQARPDWTYFLYSRTDEQRRELSRRWTGSNVHATVVPGAPNVWRLQARLPGQLRRDLVEVYHSPGYFLPLLFKGPKVVTIHDLNVYLNWRNWFRSRRIVNWADMAVQTPLAARAADAIITDSLFSKDSICRILHVPAERVVSIPLAPDAYFDEQPSPQECAEAETLIGGGPYVLYVGVLSPQKNLGTLIRAFAASTLSAEAANLVLAGADRSQHAETLRSIAASAGVSAHLRLPGFVSRPVLRALYHGALAVVLPSHGEGFGLPLVEAMAAGAPVVAARRQSLPEVVGDAGCLFEPDDVQGLAQLLSRLGSNSSFRQDLIGRGHVRRQEFSWKAAADATAGVYEQVAGAKT